MHVSLFHLVNPEARRIPGHGRKTVLGFEENGHPYSGAVSIHFDSPVAAIAWLRAGIEAVEGVMTDEDVHEMDAQAGDAGHVAEVPAAEVADGTDEAGEGATPTDHSEPLES